MTSSWRPIRAVQIAKKTMDVSPMQYTDQSVDVSVAMHTPDTISQTVQKSADAPQNQYAGKVVMDAPVVLPRQAQTFQTGQETAEVSQTQHLNRVADVPVAIQLTDSSFFAGRTSTHPS